MATNVKIDFDNVYELEKDSIDFSISRFETRLKDGKLLKLNVKVDPDPHPLLHNVYNLAFGPPDNEGRIDDKVQLKHADYSRVFSTILLNAHLYLRANPGRSVGINGSDLRRACLYYRLIKNNYDYLNQFFRIGGLKYYVRISRLGKMDYDNPFDFDDIVGYPHTIKKDEHIDLDKLYNYFIFEKRK